MRQWRVGTFSMGILLILLGIVFLISTVKGIVMVEGLIKFWPAILIVLGLEIIVYLYFAKEDKPNIKYDLFSIFIVILISLLSIGFYMVSSLGLVSQATSMLASTDYSVAIPRQDFRMPLETKKIVVEAPQNRLEIKTYDRREIVLFGTGTVFAENEQQAEAMISKAGLRTNQIGDTLFLQFAELSRMHDFRLGVKDMRYTLFLPEDIEVEVKRYDHYGYPLEIDATAIKKNWFIGGNGQISIKVSNESNFSLDATVGGHNDLFGNINWIKEEYTRDERVHSLHGTATFGQGGVRVVIVNRGDVEVNNIN